MKLNKLVLGLLLCGSSIYGQQASQSWYHDDAASGTNGTSARKAFKELIKDKKGQTVIVAVIDSGIDVDHEDLKQNIWVNAGEIPNNGIDDDKNGFVDDIHGWNFIGGKDGKNVGSETLEATRLYAAKRYKFENADPKKLSKNDLKEYELFLKLKDEVEKGKANAQAQLDQINGFETIALKGLNKIETALVAKNEGILLLSTAENPLKNLDLETDQEAQVAANVSKQLLKQMPEIKSIADLKKNLVEILIEERKDSKNKIEFTYNPDFDSRKTIVKDNDADPYEKNYGNNDVQGPDALHGTHVAGIIGSVNDNGMGNDGIAKNVLLMSVRAVPDGDERDKDVANAIRYAVDNGASIINMSFGKGYSWNKKLVDEAVEYAAKKDVLLVHAAGNSGQDNDVTDNFPNDFLGKKGFIFKKNKYAENWLEIGALSPEGGEEMVANFSNYGKKNVDLFSPGVEIYSTTPDNKYQYLQGTSMASPVAAGVAAVIRSNFPTLTAVQVKEVLMKSVKPITDKVKKPGEGENKVPFTDLSVTGGTVNLFNAYKIAGTMKGKKKIKEQRA
jgi:cell wall-associated protease